MYAIAVILWCDLDCAAIKTVDLTVVICLCIEEFMAQGIELSKDVYS